MQPLKLHIFKTWARRFCVCAAHSGCISPLS